MLSQTRILFLDFQTTGPKPESGEILEMAWAGSDGAIHENVIRPERTKVSPFIQKMTGINDAVLATAVSLEEAVFQLNQFLNSYNPQAVVIHYAKFEQPFLDELKSKLNLAFEIPVLCTHEIAKRIYPNLPARGVAGLAGYFGWAMSEKKRGRDHVEATKAIWKGLLPQLESNGISELSSLLNWLQNTKPAKKTKYEYPLDKDKRLSLPEKPGLYRMLGKNGEVLYVGKATSLRARVNSYFRGQKKRNSFKLQMLAQVWDVDVTVCDSALEAALLESDEIKKWNPRYNIALKANERELTFYSRDFTSEGPSESAIHILGPFPGKHSLSPIVRLFGVINENSGDSPFPEDLLFEKIATDVLKEGFLLFREKYSVNAAHLNSVRSMLGLGMKWYREYLKTEEIEEEEQADEEEEQPEDDAEREYTAEEVAEKFLWLFHHSAAALYRSKRIKKLCNCEVDIGGEDGAGKKTLFINGGKLNPASDQAHIPEWDIATYDRLSVLQAETKRLGFQVRVLNKNQ